jgi:hypothetical protein
MSAEAVGTCVSWIVQDLDSARMRQLLPSDFAAMWALSNFARKENFLFVEFSASRIGGTSSLECLEEEPDRSLHLLVWIKFNLAICVVNEPDRQVCFQFTTLGFVDDSAHQTRSQYMQLGFTHGAF